MPSIKKGEKKSDFVSRCIGNEGMNKEFPNQRQRTAVCFSLWEQAKKKKQSKGEAGEPTWEEWDDNPGIIIIP